MTKDQTKSKRTGFPKGGKSWEILNFEMDQLTTKDIDWEGGRSPLYVFKGTEEALNIGKKGFMKFFNENALGGKRVFFGLKRMEEDLINFGLDLFNAPIKAGGCITTGGSESIVIAVKAARDNMRSKKNKPTKQLNIVAPITVHPAFDKACNLMDIEIRRANIQSDCRVDVDHIESLIDEHTMLIVGSAPCFPHGVIDPIEKLSALAIKLDIWLHVDACVGGYILPFLKMSGRELEMFDFNLIGVKSISADLHKFGFCPKPISSLFFREEKDQNNSKFVYDTWPSGKFETFTISGTRSGGAIAGAWSVINHLGVIGYKKIATELNLMIKLYVKGIESIDGLYMINKPDATIINYSSRDLDIYSIAERFGEKGWVPGLTKTPKGIHAMMSMYHEPIREEYLEDLSDSVKYIRERKNTKSTIKAVY